MSRRMIWAIAGTAVAAAMAGGAVSEAVNPASSSQSLSSQTSVAAPSHVAAAVPAASESTASTSSSVASTSAAAVLPAAPVLAMACPAGVGAAPTFAHKVTAVAPYTVAIDYGDGDRYTDDNQHLKAIFGHKYLKAGTFTVAAVLTDATGQSTTATCAYSWTAPAPVHLSVPAPHSSTSGSGSTVHSSVTASTAPSGGATARCNDGTLSYSQNHRGTCSHHGGVAEWL
jgi:hypothetical protein